MEQRAAYQANDTLLQTPCEPVTITPETRAQLVDLERQLISALVTVQRALGKELSVITRSERRRG